MDTFQNISVTLPRQRLRKQVFYSTAKNWRDQSATLDVNKNSYLKQLSCKTQKNKPLKNIDLKLQYGKLQQKLKEKNELLVKQSNWKNYFLKEEICVLLQQILICFDSVLQETKLDPQLRAYRNKLQKVIQKVQMKRKSSPEWLEFFGLNQGSSSPVKSVSKDVQTLSTEKRQSVNEQIQNPLFLELSRLRQENQCMIRNISILTQEIELKQKDLTLLHQKYSKAKTKKEKYKSRFNQIQIQYQQLLNQYSQSKNKIQSNQNLPNPKNHTNIKHLHTYSWDKEFIHQKSPSINYLNFEEGSENLFTLSDTPFIVDHKRVIPVSTEFLQVKRKILGSQKQPAKKDRQASVSIESHHSLQQALLTKQKESLLNDQRKKKKNELSQNSLREMNETKHIQQPTFSIICDIETECDEIYRKLLLSQALTIENLLNKI